MTQESEHATSHPLPGDRTRWGLRNFPPVLAFQSAVDATIPTQAVVEGLLRHLAPGNAHQLVVFDDRIIHGVQPVQGTMDPLQGRVDLLPSSV